MTAKGKINASKVQIGDRIIVNTQREFLNGSKGTYLSDTKTGEFVTVARVTGKHFRSAQGAYERRGKYVIETTAGTFEAATIQTMWLAPEDNAGIKRAHVEALAEDMERAAVQKIEDADRAEAEFNPESGASAPDANRHEAQTGGRAYLPEVGSPEMAALVTSALRKDAPEFDLPDLLTLNSHGGKVVPVSENDEPQGDEMTTTANTREMTGSAVVRLLEKVYDRIRQNHPDLPAVVMVTGSGADLMGQKWGHFRPKGWMAKIEEEGAARHLDEMFMAGETLAKGARQVLQTMLHESAHTLCEQREIKDTSRQGRWHNRAFVKMAEEMGLEYKHGKANPQIGFSQVTLTEETLEEYADLLAELDAEINLTVKLPYWLGGSAGGDGDGEDEGGETMGRKPKGPEGKTSTSNTKLTCTCEEPNIIRASKKVAEKMVVRCDDCKSLFKDRG